MENEKLNQSLKVIVEVNTTNYSNNGKLKTVFGGKGEISKKERDRVLGKDEDSIAFRATDCGTAKMEAEYASVAIGQGEVKTDIEFDLKGQQFDMNKGELIDAIASSSKLSKADAGRSLDTAIEDLHKLSVSRSCEAECASVESIYTTKTREIIE